MSAAKNSHKIMKNNIIVILLFLSTLAQPSVLFNNRATLYDDLFLKPRKFMNISTIYNSAITPTHAFEDPLEVYASIWINEIVAFDTLNQLLTFTSTIDLHWLDSRLGWDPENYNNVTDLSIPLDRVWRPEIGVLNSAQANSRFYDEVNINEVFLESDGFISWAQDFEHVVKCPMHLKYFPFDLQSCTIEIGAVTNRLEVLVKLVRAGEEALDIGSKKIESLKPIKQSSLNFWTLLGNHVLELDSKNEIAYVILLKRKSSLYFTDMVVPCALLSFLSGCSLFVIQDLPVRLEINLSVLVALSVYQMIASGNLPHTDDVPLLSLFLLAQVIMVYSVLVYTVVMWQVSGKNNRPPKILHDIIVNKLGCLCGLKPLNETNSSAVSEKEKKAKATQEWHEILTVFDKIVGLIYLITFLTIILLIIIAPNDDHQIESLIDDIKKDIEDFECVNGVCVNVF